MRRNRIKWVLFSLLPLFLLLIAAEIGVRAFYFQARSGSHSGLEMVFENLNRTYIQKFSQGSQEASRAHELFFKIIPRFTEPVGQDLLAELKKKYTADFTKLMAEIRSIGARPLLLYIPSQETEAQLVFRDFFQGLAKANQIEVLDMTQALSRYAVKQTTLLPEDPHLSRLGNQIVAEEIAAKIKDWQNARPMSSQHIKEALYGDLKPNNSTVWELAKPIAFVAGSNGQGLRNQNNFQFPKKNRRVLCLGDSFTFGLYVARVHSYPYLLEEALPGTEVANAGVSGYTIEDELALFSERAKFLDPDIVVLQVYDNDLTDQLWFLRRVFAREKSGRDPSELERKFFHELF